MLFNNNSIQIKKRIFRALPNKSQRRSFDLEDLTARKLFHIVCLKILNQLTKKSGSCQLIKFKKVICAFVFDVLTKIMVFTIIFYPFDFYYHDLTCFYKA